MELLLKEVSEQSGYSVPHLLALIKRGHIPAGRKEGKNRLMPDSVLEILSQHKPGTEWKRRAAGEPVRRAPACPKAAINLADLIGGTPDEINAEEDQLGVEAGKQGSKKAKSAFPHLSDFI